MGNCQWLGRYGWHVWESDAPSDVGSCVLGESITQPGICLCMGVCPCYSGCMCLHVCLGCIRQSTNNRGWCFSATFSQMKSVGCGCVGATHKPPHGSLACRQSRNVQASHMLQVVLECPEHSAAAPTTSQCMHVHSFLAAWPGVALVWGGEGRHQTVCRALWQRVLCDRACEPEG
jgi:hypothetical protein